MRQRTETALQVLRAAQRDDIVVGGMEDIHRRDGRPGGDDGVGVALDDRKMYHTRLQQSGIEPLRLGQTLVQGLRCEPMAEAMVEHAEIYLERIVALGFEPLGIGSFHRRPEEVILLQVEVVSRGRTHDQQGYEHGHGKALVEQTLVVGGSHVVRSASYEAMDDMYLMGIMLLDKPERPQGRSRALGVANDIDAVKRQTGREAVEYGQHLQVEVEGVTRRQFAMEVGMHAVHRHAIAHIIGLEDDIPVAQRHGIVGRTVGRRMIVGEDGEMRKEDDAFGRGVLRHHNQTGHGKRIAMTVYRAIGNRPLQHLGRHSEAQSNQEGYYGNASSHHTVGLKTMQRYKKFFVFARAKREYRAFFDKNSHFFGRFAKKTTLFFAKIIFFSYLWKDKRRVGDLTALRPGEGYLFKRLGAGEVDVTFYDRSNNSAPQKTPTYSERIMQVELANNEKNGEK